jgi:hypothetical protein
LFMIIMIIIIIIMIIIIMIIIIIIINIKQHKIVYTSRIVVAMMSSICFSGWSGLKVYIALSWFKVQGLRFMLVRLISHAGFRKLLWYLMVSYVMSCHVMSCHVMSCHVILCCYDMLCNIC